MRRTILVALIALVGCVASAKSSTGVGSATTYQEPAPPPPETEPAGLEGTYVQGLGDPLVHVINSWSAPLTISLTDAYGVYQSFYLEVGQTSDIRVAPGAFSYSVSDGIDYLDGAFVVEADTEYEWYFSAKY